MQQSTICPVLPINPLLQRILPCLCRYAPVTTINRVMITVMNSGGLASLPCLPMLWDLLHLKTRFGQHRISQETSTKVTIHEIPFHISPLSCGGFICNKSMTIQSTSCRVLIRFLLVRFNSGLQVAVYSLYFLACPIFPYIFFNLLYMPYIFNNFITLR